MPPLDVLYEDNHLLVVNKPAGLITQGADAGAASVVSLAKNYLKQKYQKKGAVYLGVVSRLDSPVSGVLVLARTSKAAARLTEQFRSREVEKIYWAATCAKVQPPSGDLRHLLVHDDASRRVLIVPAGDPRGRQAVLRYRTLQKCGLNTLLEIHLETGRKHQIRAQLAAAGMPVLGDDKYGRGERFSSGIALHSRRLSLLHPTRGERLTFIAPLPPSWSSFGFADSAEA